jgi:hypothetical protein
MFGIFGGRSKESLTLEQKLAILADCGLSLAPPFTAEDLLESWPREDFERPGYGLTLVGLGMTEERPPWRNHSLNVWHFDTECINGEGSYVRIAERLTEMTQGALVIRNARDHVDLEARIANLEFEFSGESAHLDFEVNHDWVDGAVFSQFVRLLGRSDPSKVFLRHATDGQDGIIACVGRSEYAALKKAGVKFEPLK